MAASDSVNRGQFWFHGTSADLAPGDVVRPAAEVGKAGEPGTLGEAANPHHAFAARDLGEAHMWAEMKGGGNVYKVEPTHPVEEFHSPEGYTYGRSKGFRVVEPAGPSPVSRDEAMRHHQSIKRQEGIRRQRRERSTEVHMEKNPKLRAAIEGLSDALFGGR